MKCSHTWRVWLSMYRIEFSESAWLLWTMPFASSDTDRPSQYWNKIFINKTYTIYSATFFNDKKISHWDCTWWFITRRTNLEWTSTHRQQVDITEACLQLVAKTELTNLTHIYLCFVRIHWDAPHIRLWGFALLSMAPFRRSIDEILHWYLKA